MKVQENWWCLGLALLLITGAPALAQEVDDRDPHRDVRERGDALSQSILDTFLKLPPEQRERLIEAFRPRDGAAPSGAETPEPGGAPWGHPPGGPGGPELDEEQQRALQEFMRRFEPPELDAPPEPEPRGRQAFDAETGPRPRIDPEVERRIREAFGAETPQGEGFDPSAIVDSEGGEPPSWIAEMLENEDMRALFEDVAKGMSSAVESDRAAGGDGRIFPWLDDPSFPKELLARGQERSELDDMLKDFAGNDQVKGWLTDALSWRRDREDEVTNPTPRATPQPTSPSPGSDPTETPEPGAPSRPLDIAAELDAGWSWAGWSAPDIRGWALPELPKIPLGGVGAPALPRINLSGGIGGAPSFEGAAWMGGALLLFAAFAVALLFAPGGPLGGVRAEPSAFERPPPVSHWPVAPRSMASHEDLIANVLHINRCLEPTRRLDHLQLQRRCEGLCPQRGAEVSALIADFSACYYRRPWRPLGEGRWREHGQTLDALGAAITARGG